MKIWKRLISAARSRRTYTYKDLAKSFGMRGQMDPLRMAKPLGPIMYYCNQKGFPPLTALVVNKRTGVPGRGLKPEGRYKNKDMRWNKDRVFGKNWLIIKQPKESDFQNAYETAKRRKKP